MKNLEYQIKKQIGIIYIRRPESLNALNRQTVKELDQLLKQIRGNKEIRALIMGSKENFAAGADIREMVRCDRDEARNFSFSNTFNALENLKIPTIAAIDGYALGGGLELALACDLRIASQTAKLGFPEINLGIMPGAGGTIRTPRLLGEARAKEMIFLGEVINGIKAEQLGLVNKAVPKENLMETAEAWAEKLIEKAPLALLKAKETIDAGISISSKYEALEFEREKWSSLFDTDDQHEGMMAFLEKRSPCYNGK